jgi:tetratricopeptide (TPR) repeat protein
VEFFEQKDYAKALEAYDQAIALDPEFARAWMNKGNLYWKMGEYYKAVAAYNRAIEICPAAGQLPDEGIYYFRRAISYGAMRNYPQTIADLEKALELGFDQSDCYYNLGLVYENMKDTEKAAAACRKAVELGNEDAQSKLDKMLVKAEAEAAANAAITYTPAEDFEYENTADGEGICIKGFKNTRAKTVAVPPEIDGKPVTEIGAQAFKPCKSLRSVTLTVTVVEIGTSAFENCKALAEIALPPRLARIKYIAFAGCKVLAAISLPRSLKSIGSRAFEDCAALEKISLPASLQELGSEVFSGCTALQTIWVLGNPGVFTYGASVGCNADIVYSENAEKYPYTWLEKASAYRNQGEYLDALEALDRAIAMEPANWRHYVARGKIWKEMKVYAKALADFRKAIELHPDNAGSNAEENTALISLNNEVETCTKHEAEVPDPVALWEEGTMHYQRAEKGGYEGEFREALKDFNRTIALKPDFVQAWTSKGALYKDMGELDKAIAAYSRAIELVPAAGQLPREGSYYFFRSAVWYELEDCGKALADILQALQLNPEEGAYYNNMGFICEQLEDKAKAIVAFQKAVEFGYEEAREELERLEADSGDGEDSEQA